MSILGQAAQSTAGYIINPLGTIYNQGATLYGAAASGSIFSGLGPSGSQGGSGLTGGLSASGTATDSLIDRIAGLFGSYATFVEWLPWLILGLVLLVVWFFFR